MIKKALFILSMLSVFVLPVPVTAQQTSIGISQPVTQVVTKPGRDIIVPVQFTNLKDPLTASIIIKELKVNKLTGDLDITNDRISSISASLINASIDLDERFNFLTKETKDLNVGFDIPSDLSGDYYFGVFLQSQPPPAKEGTATVQLHNAVGSLIALSVTPTGELETDTRISLFSIVPHYRLNLFGKRFFVMDSAKEIPIKLTVHNGGTNFTQIQGKIEVNSSSGYKKTFPLNNETIFGDSQKTYDFLTTMSVIGKYSANVTIVDKNAQGTLHSTTQFYVFPVMNVLTAFGLLLLAILFLFYILRKYKKHRRE